MSKFENELMKTLGLNNKLNKNESGAYEKDGLDLELDPYKLVFPESGVVEIHPSGKWISLDEDDLHRIIFIMDEVDNLYKQES